jgi:hypothetical protein
VACCIAPANPLRITFDDYKGGLIAPWEKKSFKVSDSYGIAKGRKIPCIETHRLAAMPVPYYEINHDAKQYPILSWWRKVTCPPKKDVHREEGDNYVVQHESCGKLRGISLLPIDTSFQILKAPVSWEIKCP